MLFEFLIFLFVLLCLLLIPLVLVQKGKSSLGAAYLGSGAQTLFGGSGGQDVFQKATWVLGALFMGGSLLLGIMRRPSSRLISKISAQQRAPQPTSTNTK